MNAQERLKQYVEEDSIYNDYLNGKTNISDFDKFCIQHCEDIEKILNENKKLKEKITNIVEYAYGTDMLVCEYEQLCKIAEVE